MVGCLASSSNENGRHPVMFPDHFTLNVIFLDSDSYGQKKKKKKKRAFTTVPVNKLILMSPCASLPILWNGMQPFVLLQKALV